MLSDALRISKVAYHENKIPQNLGDRAFHLLWHRTSAGKSKQLSKSLTDPAETLGSLEIIWPSLVVRGRHVIEEFQRTVTQNMLKRNIE